MIREMMFTLLLLVPLHAAATESASSAPEATAIMPAPQSTAPALPPMFFLSSVAEDEVLAVFKTAPAFSGLDKELVGSPLTLVVTHTVRPTAGGQAAGFLSAVLSGSTLGLIPVVSNERFVVRYEVRLNGKPVTSHSFENTATRATNIWTAGADNYAGLGKAGLEWLKSTATEAAAKLERDPALLAVRDEIDFYFTASAPAGGK